MRYFSTSDRGMIREINEDSCFSGELNGYILFILADGMGGHKGGEKASKKAIETVIAVLSEKLTAKMIPGQIMLLLSEALECANREIISLAKTDSTLSGMGTTCDICLIVKNTAYIAHIGDSRVYKISKKSGDAKKLTKDHSLVEYMIETGAITREESINHPQKNVILRALGTSTEINADVLKSNTICLNPEEDVILQEDYENLLKEISEKLSTLEYKILTEFLKEQNYEEIAKNLNLTKKSVDNALTRIRNKLKYLKVA